MEKLIILAGALAIDLTMGELPTPIHPVGWMGRLAAFLEKPGKSGHPLLQFFYGAFLTIFLAAFFAAAGYFFLYYLRSAGLVIYVIMAAALLKTTFSLGGLRKAAWRVRDALLEDKTDRARYELRSLVSRDVSTMSREQAVSAVVESVAENICDSFVAPLLYFMLLGIPGALAYRVINTLDAMIGYHGEYEYLGKFAARLDDVLNYVPARISALLLATAAFLSGKGFKAGWKGALAEHAETESPNAGWTMAAMAGALNVQLEKTGHYRLGRPDNPLEPQTIDSSLRITMLAAFLWAAICLAAGGLYFAFTTPV